MKKEIITGLILITAGLGLFAYYSHYLKPEIDARELLVQGKLIFERGTDDAVNNSINIFTELIARYPSTESAYEAYYHVARGYEKLNLNRLAYLKYMYILKTRPEIEGDLEREVRARLARLSILKSHSDEGIHQLFSILNNTSNKELRSRVYTELGHTYLKQGDVGRSREMFDIALSENGSNEEALIGKARALKRMGEDNRAYDLYEYFLKYFSNFSHFTDDVYNAYLEQVYQSGFDSYKKGSYHAGIEFFNRLLNFFPDNEKTENALYWKGECYYSLKDYKSAIKIFDRVLDNSFNQKDQDARMKKGYSYFMLKSFDLAAREFQKYLAAYPGGKHAASASKWKKMCTTEILYRIRNKMVEENQDIGEDEGSEDQPDDSGEEADDSGEEAADSSSGVADEDIPDVVPAEKGDVSEGDIIEGMKARRSADLTSRDFLINRERTTGNKTFKYENVAEI